MLLGWSFRWDPLGDDLEEEIPHFPPKAKTKPFHHSWKPKPLSLIFFLQLKSPEDISICLYCLITRCAQTPNLTSRAAPYVVGAGEKFNSTHALTEMPELPRCSEKGRVALTSMGRGVHGSHLFCGGQAGVGECFSSHNTLRRETRDWFIGEFW